MRTGKLFFVALIVTLLLAAGLGQAATPGIIVADASNHRIVQMNDMAGAGWATFGTRGSGVNQFIWPRAVFVDAQGRIYVVDQDNHRIVRMDDMTGAGWVTFGALGTGETSLRGHARFLSMLRARSTW